MTIQNELETRGEIETVRIAVGRVRGFSGAPLATHALDCDGLAVCRQNVDLTRLRRWQAEITVVTCGHCRRHLAARAS